MMQATLRRALLAAALLFAPQFAVAQISVPPLAARVTDLTGTLTGEQRAAIEAALASLESRKGSQVAVLMVPSVQPETIEQYAIRVFDQWQLGRKGVDDGVLLVIAKNDRKLRIEVGRGLEGAIPDAIAKRIIDEDITPRFKQGDFFGGVHGGVDRITRLIDGEPMPPPRAHAEGRGASPDFFTWLIIAFFIAGIIGPLVHGIFGRLPGAGIVGGGLGAFAWFVTGFALLAALTGLLAFIIVLVGGLGRRGGWSGSGGSWSSGGGFSSGGSSGGGFSGGGGSSAGGGASGSW